MRTMPFCALSLAFGAFIFFSECKILPLLFFILFAVYSFFKFRDAKIASACLLFVFPGFLSAYCDDYENKISSMILSPYENKFVSVSGRITALRKTLRGFAVEAECDKIVFKKTEHCLPKKAGVIILLDDLSDIRINGAIVAKGVIARINSMANPNVFSYSDFMGKKNIFYSLKYSEIIAYTENTADSFFSFATGLKENAVSGILKNHGDESGAVVCGIVFGDRSMFQEGMADIFRRSGTFHLLAASGFNISLISAFCFLIFKKLRINAFLSFVLICFFVCMYSVMAGSSPSIIRAALMSSVAFAASGFGRDYDLPSALSFSAFSMIAFRPSYVCDCGFQLSVGAVAGICAYMMIIRPHMQGIGGILKFVSESFMISFSAELAAVPLCAYWFCSWAPVSFVSNLFAAPLAAMILAFGMIESGFVLLLPSFSFVPAAVCDFFAHVLIFWNSYISSLPFAFFDVCAPSEQMLAVYFASVFLFLNFYKGRLSVFSVPVFPLILLAASYLIPPAFDGAEAVFFDVGDSDACLFITEEGRTVLIDCGSSGKNGGIDSGGGIIAPFLLKKGFKSLDYVFITHNHDDHCGGFNSLAKKVNVKHVLVSPFMPYVNKSERISAGDVIYISGSASVTVVYPSAGDRPVDENDSSLVLIVDISGTRFLMCGDIEKHAEKIILGRNSDIHADVIKAAHHGSSTSSSNDFIAGVLPKLCVITAGMDNKKGHPSPDVLKAFDDKLCRTIQTGISGAVCIRHIHNGNYDIKLIR